MKKLLLLSAIAASAATAAHAGVAFNVGIRLPHADVVIGQPAVAWNAGYAATSVYGTPVYAQSEVYGTPVYSTPACPPVVVSAPICEPAPVCAPTIVVPRPRVVVRPDYYPRRVVYHHDDRNHGYRSGWRNDRDDHRGRW